MTAPRAKRRKARGWVHRHDLALTRETAFWLHGVQLDQPEDFVYVEEVLPRTARKKKAKP